MHELIKFCGGIVALAGAAGIALAVYLKLHPGSTTAPVSEIHAAIYGVSVLIAGIVLYCLGAVIDHLKAIRDFQRRQIEIFERMGKKRPSPTSDTTSIAADRASSASSKDAPGAASPNSEDQPEAVAKQAS